MKKIIVAGAGHGGVTAAALLAKAGYDVTVYERAAREDLGYEWYDTMGFDCLEAAGIPLPPEDKWFIWNKMALRSPSGKYKVSVPLANCIFMDRKYLIAHLIDFAEQAGVKFVFGQEVCGAVVDGSRVKGVLLRKGKTEVEAEAELVIDAAGFDSPVRRSLPINVGIRREIPLEDTIQLYRIVFDNLDGTRNDPEFTVDMLRQGRVGIDWTETDDETVDILVGKFGGEGPLTQEEIDAAIAGYREEFPFIGEKKVAAGYGVKNLPITRMLPVIVADGYALVGDSAGMTVPLNGCGINLSIHAGKILADTVIEADSASKAVLWKYEYEYFTRFGFDLVPVDILRNLTKYVNEKQVEYLFAEKILTEEVVAFADGGKGGLPVSQIVNILFKLPGLYTLFPAAAKTLKSLPALPLVKKNMPREYDKAEVAKWAKLYAML